MRKFSLLTAGFNSQLFIEDWKNSIFSQQYRPLEVVFVDDCSQDETFQVVSSLKKDFSDREIDFKIIRNSSRKFYASTLKIACNSSSGFYIGILDSDDKIIEDACDRIVDVYEKNPEVDWIYTAYAHCNMEMNKFKNGLSSYPKFGSLLADGEHRRHTYSHWRTFTRKMDSIDDIFCDGLKSAVDKYMGYRLEEKGTGAFLNEIFYYYRYGVPTSITKTEATISSWKHIVKQFCDKRKIMGITPYRIIKL